MTESTTSPDQLIAEAEQLRETFGDRHGWGGSFMAKFAQAAKTLEAVTAERDALAAILAEARDTLNDTRQERQDHERLWAADAVLSKLPADALAARDAEKWEEGKRAMTGWKQGHPLPPNPYRIEREARS